MTNTNRTAADLTPSEIADAHHAGCWTIADLDRYASTLQTQTHCTGCGLHLSEQCLPGCPERDAFYASYDNAVRGGRS